MKHILHTQPRPVTKRTVILILIMVGAIAFLASCSASRGCNGSAKMIGYGTKTSKVLKNNR
jgi:hypothetical protein